MGTKAKSRPYDLVSPPSGKGGHQATAVSHPILQINYTLQITLTIRLPQDLVFVPQAKHTGSFFQDYERGRERD